MKKTCFLMAVFIWAPALLFIPQPCHADLIEMSDQALDGITGQAGILIRAEEGSDDDTDAFAVASNSGKDLYPGNIYLATAILQDWIFDDMGFNFLPGNAVNEVRMTSGIVTVERTMFQTEMEMDEKSAGTFGIYDFRARFSGNVHLYAPVD